LHTLKPAPLVPSSSAGYNSPVPPVSQTIRVSVLFFGRLKELTGHAEDSIEFADATTIEQLFALYAARYPELAKYRSSVVASRNQEFAAWDTPLLSGDEVAFLPPVSGG
jgi:molybdopterin synthase sulfur carrier subunit